MRRKELVPVALEGAGKLRPLGAARGARRRLRCPPTRWSISCPPSTRSIHQRKRVQLFFDYEHRFEAYVPKEKRLFGYFALPVLVGDEIVAAIDLKTDRERQKLMMQKWTWVGRSARPVAQAADRGGAAPLRALSTGAVAPATQRGSQPTGSCANAVDPGAGPPYFSGMAKLADHHPARSHPAQGFGAHRAHRRRAVEARRRHAGDDVCGAGRRARGRAGGRAAPPDRAGYRQGRGRRRSRWC